MIIENEDGDDDDDNDDGDDDDGDDDDGKITAQAFDQPLPWAVQRNQMLRWGCFVALGVKIIMISAENPYHESVIRNASMVAYLLVNPTYQ